MILLPAVDIRDGHAVRLRQGDFDDETVYADDPLEAARSFVEAGARFLHVVDLDGARAGAPASLGHLKRITSELDVPVQYGGGLRSLEAVRDALAAGADRVVVGTAAYTDPDLLDRALEMWGGRVLVAVDVRGGQVSVAGWTKEMQMRGEDVIERLQRRGASRFVYTNVDRDGMLEGPDLDEIRRVSAAVRGRFLYSGGIGSIENLTALRDMRLVNLAGVISGKALYEGRFDVRSGQAALEERRLMLLRRVIPCLDVDKGRVVKGVEFVNLRDAGDPVELAVRYQEAGADEIVFLDITASHEKRETAAALARRCADDVFIPFTIGGGVRSVEDAQAVLDAGADKVSVNSAAVARPELLGRHGGGVRVAVRGAGGGRQTRRGRWQRGARAPGPRGGPRPVPERLRRIRERRPHARWAATPWSGCARPCPGERGRYCSRAWTATAPRRGMSSS